MNSDNRISADITAEIKTQILTKLDEIRALLPFLINLTPEERKRIPTIGTERTGMVAAFTAQMTAHPDLLPGFVELPEVLKDRKLREDLLEIFRAFTELQQAQSDTLQLIGSELYSAFMSFYANVQLGASRNADDAETVLNELKTFIPRGRPAKGTTPPA